MVAPAVRTVRAEPVAAGLALVALVAWVAVSLGAADLEGADVPGFAVAWTVMMAAMMLPSLLLVGRAVAGVAPSGWAVTPFVLGYLLTWAAFGLGVGGVLAAARAAGVDVAGPVATGAVLLAAAIYQLTPAKDACLRRCRHPLGLVVTHWRPGAPGALRMGVVHGAWCAGCCWALMAVLLALGAMSVGWMLLVAALVSMEKLLPWKRAATGTVTAVLVALVVIEVAA